MKLAFKKIVRPLEQQPFARKNILFLIDEFIDAGGTEKHLLQLAAGLDRSRYEVIISPIHNGNTIMMQKARSFGISVQPFPLKRLYGVSVISKTVQLARFLARNEVDILQTYHFVSDVWGSLAARLARVPIVISNRRDKGFKENMLHRILRKITRSCINLTICVSDDLAHQIRQQERPDADKVLIAYNGVETFTGMSLEKKTQKRIELGLDSDTVVIGTVMNFRPIKGIDYLVEAATMVCERFPNVTFVCVGGGADSDSLDYFNRLLKRIDELNLSDHFKFLGKRHDVQDLLQVFDLFVLPSLSEGFSNALIEAMHAGNSIVATHVGGNSEAILQGEHGILVPPADVQAISRALIRLLEDPTEAKRLGRNAQERAERLFTTTRMIARYDEIYQGKINQLK